MKKPDRQHILNKKQKPIARNAQQMMNAKEVLAHNWSGNTLCLLVNPATEKILDLMQEASINSRKLKFNNRC